MFRLTLSSFQTEVISSLEYCRLCFSFLVYSDLRKECSRDPVVQSRLDTDSESRYAHRSLACIQDLASMLLPVSVAHHSPVHMILYPKIQSCLQETCCLPSCPHWQRLRHPSRMLGLPGPSEEVRGSDAHPEDFKPAPGISAQDLIQAISRILDSFQTLQSDCSSKTAALP